MTVAAQAGVFGIAPQPSKFGDGAYNPASYSWRRFRVPRVSVGAMQMQDYFPAELGGDIVPEGAYKMGVAYAGDVDILPRTANLMGLLFYAIMGNVSTVTGRDMNYASVTGVNTHIFNFNQLNTLPWFSVYRSIPGQTTANTLAEYGIDCMANNLQLTVPAMGKIMMRLSIQGRRTYFVRNPSPTWANTYEPGVTVPEAVSGSCTIGNLSPKFQAITINFLNNLSSVQDEMIVGSPYPDDFIPLSRQATIDAVVKWEDPDLYQQLLTNSTSGNNWSNTPFETVTNGTFAFNLVANSPAEIAGSSPTRRYALAIRANKVTWMPAGPVELAAGGIVQMRVQGTVARPDSGSYFEVVLQNDVASYTWA